MEARSLTKIILWEFFHDLYGIGYKINTDLILIMKINLIHKFQFDRDLILIALNIYGIWGKDNVN